jgi:hypothetical protein
MEMSEQSSAPKPASPAPETQSERRFKYGINVTVAVIAAIVASGVIVGIVQSHDRRLDTTAAGEFSLKQQTLNVIDNLKGKVTLVSLYTHTKPTNADTENNNPDQNVAPVTDQAQVVADLLDEYKRDGKNIDVEVIDPNTEKDKLSKLHDQLVENYGSEIKSYKDFLADWDNQYKQFEQLTTAEAAAMTAVTGGATLDDSDDTKSTSGFRPDLIRTIKALPRSLASVKDDANTERSQKYPDWKKATGDVKDFLQQLSDLSGTLATNFAKLKDEKDVPENVRKYMAESQPRFEQIKTSADALIQKASKLGELKLDTLEDALKVENPILVLGPDDWRVLQYRQVWPEDKALRDSNGVKIQPRFAGEQQITAAIYSLTTNIKPKLCFVRPGGQPLTPAGFPPCVPAGLLSEIADRMRLYDFQISEKDLSGQWAMQAQMQQMPSAPEPSDEEIKDAIWVVLDMGHEFSSGQEQAPPPPIAPKIKAHLDQGGSALIVFGAQDDDLSGALDSWGIHLHPDTLVVHEAIHLDPGSQPDIVEQFKSHPTDFVINDYGDHEITRPVQSLDSVWVPTMAVTTTKVPDATPVSLVPMDKAFPGLKVWGDTNIDALRDGGTPTYDPAKDMAPSIYGMAVSEKKSGARVVVMGSPLMFNGRINIPDPVIAETQNRYVSRFPGNGELTANSLFWLAHLDPMIAISPEAMDVSRISPMSHGALQFWRYGVLLILLPGAVIAAGLFVYAGRRD